MHGVVMIFFFLIPSIPAVLGNFLIPLMIGARDLAFPILNLLSWYLYMIGGHDRAVHPDLRRDRHRLDVLHAVLDDVLQHDGGARGAGGVHHGVLVDPDRAELHRDGAHDAGAGDDLVPAAAVRLVALRDQPDPGAGHPGAGDRRRADRRRAAAARRDLRPQAGGRPDPVPAPVLVLLAPGGVHHGAARDGGDQRDRPVLLAAADLRLQVHRVLEHRDRGPGLPGLGPPHVRLGPVDVRRDGVLDPELPGGDPVGDQGLQLDGHDVQGVDPARDADALRPGLHRPVHARRPDGADARLAGDRRARARHVFRRGPLPLHHGGRGGDGLPGRHPLLVAQADGADVFRAAGQALGAGGLRRLQPDVLPAVHPGLPGDAASVLRVSARVPGPERDVDGRCVDPGGGLRAAAGLSAAVAAAPAERRPEPVGGDGPGVADRPRRRRCTTSTRPPS